MEKPRGYCYCGCGAKTAMAIRSNKKRGDKVGYPVKYIKGHHKSESFLPIKERFWAKVKISGLDDCWEWQGLLIGNTERKQKYGSYGIIKSNGKQKIASRVAWELTHGDMIPDGYYVLHKCDNPPCCNPNHLFIGTHRDNMIDMMAKNRGRQNINPPTGTRQHMAKLNDEIVKYVRSVYKRGNAEFLAQQFGVTYPVMLKAINGTTWAHVK